MEVDEGSDQKSDISSHWVAGHAGLKNEFTEDEKCHNLITWLLCNRKWNRYLLQYMSHVMKNKNQK